MTTPAQPKISANDPSLLVPARPRANRLRKGPLIAGLVALSVIITAGVLAAELVPSEDDSAEKKEPPKFLTATVPDDILRVPPPPPPRLPDPPAAEPAPAQATVTPAAATTAPTAAADTGPGSRAERKRERMEAYWRGRSADIGVDLGQGSSELAPHAPAVARAQPESRFARSGASPEPPPLPIGADPNLQGRKNDFLGMDRGGDGYLHERLQKPRSPYELKAGAIIPASLITAINSDLPGAVIGQVRENVYDTVTGQYLLIPQGARLLATYDSMVVWGQERVLVCWDRIVFPNGADIQLHCMPGADLAGAAGLTDEVDEHWWRLIRGAAIASLLSGVTTAAAGNTTGYQPTLPQLWARGAASEVASTASEITQRNIRVQPTIRVRQAWSMNVIVTRDMILEPYVEAPGDDEG